MKKNYILTLITLCSFFAYAQNYELGIVHISNYDFKIVAIPDFNSSGNTDASDIGFTLVLPTGNVDATNPTGLLTARTWSISQYDATFLSGLGLGDGTKDVFLFNLPPGQSLFSHTSGQQIDLVSFTITGSPTDDEVYFLLNNDPIALGAGNVLDSFFNSNIDETSTQDYFSNPAAGLDSFTFSTLSVSDVDKPLNDISIYPNPVNDVLNIKCFNTSEIEAVKVHTMDGKLIHHYKEFNSHQSIIKLDTSTLSYGMYFITIDSANSESITFKVMVN